MWYLLYQDRDILCCNSSYVLIEFSCILRVLIICVSLRYYVGMVSGWGCVLSTLLCKLIYLAVHLSEMWLSPDKAERLLAEAASYGSQLVVFPEAFVGGYPRGSTFGITIGNRTEKGKEEFRKYHASAIDVPGKSLVLCYLRIHLWTKFWTKLTSVGSRHINLTNFESSLPELVCFRSLFLIFYY